MINELRRVLTETHINIQVGVDEYIQSVRHSIVRQTQQQGDGYSSSPLRISSIGKPAVLQCLELPNVRAQLRQANMEYTEPTTLKTLDIFHRGDQFEALVLLTLRNSGFQVISTQTEVEFLGVPGHSDVLVEFQGQRLLLEIKTMSSAYFRQFTSTPNDDRGYVTQLGLYTVCMGVPGVWVCLDKGTSEVQVVEPPSGLLANAVDRATRIIPKFKEVNCFADIFKVFSPPPPVPEYYRNRQSGRMLLPNSMKYSPYRDLFYHLTVEENGYGRPTEYVLGCKVIDDIPDCLR
jgi:hypothetical protein